MERDLDHILDHTREAWAQFAGHRIFITGGTGFVGSWLLESLVWANRKLGADVRATVLTRDPDAFLKRTSDWARDVSISYLQGDSVSFEFPPGTFRYVIHAATQPQFDADVSGTRRVVELAGSRGTKRFLFTSSGAVYGQQPCELSHIPESYEGAPITSSYGDAKKMGEALCVMHGFDGLIARLFTFIGPRLPLDRNFAAGNFIRDVLRGGPVVIEGDGTPMRTYLYVADLTIWLWTILARGESARPYNVGSSDAVSIAELARVIVDATVPGTGIEVRQRAVHGAPIPRYVPSTERAEKELNLRARISLAEGARRTFEAQ